MSAILESHSNNKLHVYGISDDIFLTILCSLWCFATPVFKNKQAISSRKQMNAFDSYSTADSFVSYAIHVGTNKLFLLNDALA